MIIDPGVPARDLLLGSEAAQVLNLVTNEVGGSCTSARATQVRYVPGSSITVQYTCAVAWDGQPEKIETMVAVSGIEPPGETPMLEVEGTPISIWRYPNDPFLPGLPAATDPDSVRTLLEKLGAPATAPKLRRRAYRPGRRAVIEAVSPASRVFLKIVRPSRVARLQALHTSMAGHVPVPHSHGWSEELGLVAIQAMPGTTLRKAVAGGESALPRGLQLSALLDALPDPGASARKVGGPTAGVAAHVRLLEAVVPDLAGRLSSVAERIDVDSQPAVPVHGDFHSAQVITSAGAVVGLIDVDTAGLGSRADDLATMLGQISTLSLGSGKAFDRYGGDLIRDFDRLVDPRDLRARTAAAVLGFATGPFRVQQADWEFETGRRLALAEKWLESAG